MSSECHRGEVLRGKASAQEIGPRVFYSAEGCVAHCGQVSRIQVDNDEGELVALLLSRQCYSSPSGSGSRPAQQILDRAMV